MRNRKNLELGMLDKISDLRFEIVKTSHKILKGNVKGLDAGFRNFVHLIVSNDNGFQWALELYSGTYLSDEFDHCLSQINRQIKKKIILGDAIKLLSELHVPFTTPYRSIQIIIDAIISCLVIYQLYLKKELEKYLSPIPLSRCYTSGGTTPLNLPEINSEIELTLKNKVNAYKFRANVHDDDRITKVIKCIPEDFNLMVDFIGGTRETGNLETVKKYLEKYDLLNKITWFEEPFSSFDFSNYKKIKNAVKNAGICGGESLPTKELLFLFDEMGCCDYLQIDACFNINFKDAQTIKFNSKQVIHNWSGPYGTLTNIILFNFVDADWFELPLPQYDFCNCFDPQMNIFNLVANPIKFFSSTKIENLMKYDYSESYDFKWIK